MSTPAAPIVSLATLLASLALAPCATADLDHSVAMTTPQAVVADGTIGTPCTTACSATADQSYTYPAPNFIIGAAFVDPGSNATAVGPPGGGLDMSKPYAELQITHWDQTSDPVSCQTKLNPTSYGEQASGAGPGPLAEVWFDAPCNDGLGYDFYRVHFIQSPTDPPQQPGPCIEQNTNCQPQQAWSADGLAHFPEWGELEICGHNASGFTCYHNPPAWQWLGADIYPALYDVLATYPSNGPFDPLN